MIRKTKYLVFGVGVLTVCVSSFMFSRPVRAADESLTLETYYPAPYGSYSELQLYPKDTPSACNANSRGTMYYDDVTYLLTYSYIKRLLCFLKR